MSTDGDRLVEELLKRIGQAEGGGQSQDIGIAGEVGDGVVRIYGLDRAKSGELLEFERGGRGLALSLEEASVGAVLLGGRDTARQGEAVRASGHAVLVPVGEDLLGRVISAVGDPIDGKGPLNAKSFRSAEGSAPGVTDRSTVNRPLLTGIKAIDAMVPIGRGQRELIIGDRGTGKSTLAVDAVLNQTGGDVLCVYVAIGQKASTVARLAALFEERGAMGHTVIVAATAADPAPMQYLAPFAGCAIGESFMYAGRDVLIVYDDLSKHAIAYRAMSLLLRRPPGREAYPGDVFYLHARLLERAAQLDEAHGSGSMTALPIVETLAGDVSAYIPTNVISITDGQIYLDTELYYSGTRPAINAGLSISRVGGAAQLALMKAVAGRLRLELAQYRELASFARFGTDVEKSTRRRLERGKRMAELMKQPQHRPMPVGDQIAAIHAVTAGFTDDLPVEAIHRFEESYLSRLETEAPGVLARLPAEKEMPPELEQTLKQVAAHTVDTLVEPAKSNARDGVPPPGGGEARGDRDGLTGGA